MGKAHLLGHKWTCERVNKASDETINKVYALYKQRELKRVIILYSIGISRWVKIRDVHKLHQDIENDLIIKDQMADLGCLLVSTFGRPLAPVLGVAHTVKNLDLGNEH